MSDLSAPARDIFPEFNTIPRLITDEVRGLSVDVLTRRRPEKGWGGWSISEQVSHVAWIPYLIFRVIWGEILYGEAASEEAVRAKTGGADRLLDPARFHLMADILGELEENFGGAWELLEGETLGSMRGKILARRIEPDREWATGERVIDYFENLVLPAHRIGFRRDESDPHVFHQTLESAMRHALWESWTHLKTIQLHKAAEGLPTGPPVPEDGYVALLEWD